jgi:hypothetical protein
MNRSIELDILFDINRYIELLPVDPTLLGLPREGSNAKIPMPLQTEIYPVEDPADFLPNILFHINRFTESIRETYLHTENYQMNFPILPSSLECPVKNPQDLLPDKVWHIIANNISDVETFRSLALVSKSTFNICLIQYKEIMSKYERIAIYDGTYPKNPMFYLNFSDIVTAYNNKCDNPRPYIVDYHGFITTKELTIQTSWIYNGFAHIIQPIMGKR